MFFPRSGGHPADPDFIRSSAWPLSPHICNTCTLTYSVLTVGTVGSGRPRINSPSSSHNSLFEGADTIKVGQGLYDNTTTMGDSGIYAQLIDGVPYQNTSCVGTECAGSTWVVFTPNRPTETQGTDVWVTSICRIGIANNAYRGATINTNRYWGQQSDACTDAQPIHTLSYFRSGADNLATIMGWAANSPGVGPGSSPPPGLATSAPYSGPWLSAQSEVLFDPTTPYGATIQTWLTNFYANVPGADLIKNFQLWQDLDVGSGTTYKNEASSWFATKGTRYTYARVWTDNAYPQANYALNRPYGLPTCVPNHKIYTTTGTWEPDYCPVHDYILIGAGGATFTSTAGASGVTGGGGASGGSTWLQGLTTDSCCIPLDGTTSPASEVQVGGGGGGAIDSE